MESQFINEKPDKNGIHVDTILAHIRELDAKANGSYVGPMAGENPVFEFLRKALVDPDAEISEGQMIASIGEAPIATLGNFSCVIGKAKSKKTFFITQFASAFLSGIQGPIQTFKAEGKKRIIWFDTEQSRGHVQKAYRRTLAMAQDGKWHSIEVYDLRPYSPKERLGMINCVLTTQNPKSDISFSFIDGIRDLVSDINDPDQATDITTWLMKITTDKNMHICTVLHMNKGDNNARGHLGTEIINKAETVIQVQKETDLISLVKAEFCRDREFIPFAFEIDSFGMPVILEGYYSPVNDGGKPTKSSPERMPQDRHVELMTQIFGIHPQYSYSDLVLQVSTIYSSGTVAAKKAIQHCTNEGIILRAGKEGKKVLYALAPVKIPQTQLWNDEK